MEDTLKKEKDAVRREVLKARDRLAVSDIMNKSLVIQEILFNRSEFIEARTVFFYVSFRSEVSTHRMIKDSLSMGKKVVVPVTDIKNRRMLSCQINSFDELKPGAWGIPEPKAYRNSSIIPVEKLEVLAVPGVAFCEEGWRLGYGGGFFDKFINGFKGRSFGLAFDFQVLNRVPHDVHRDMRVSTIITEKKSINCLN